MLLNNFTVVAVMAAADPPAPTTACSGVHSLAGRMLCDPDWPYAVLSALAFALWRWLCVWWPLLVVAAVLALAAGALLARVVVSARRDAVDRARWVEIIPPVTLPRDAAAAWWRALTGMLHRTARHGLAPRHLAVEFVADSRGVRAGVWVPPALPVRRVAELVGHVWPGARARLTDPPRWTHPRTGTAGRVSVAEVYPAGGPWVPLADPALRAARPVEVGTDDVLRGLFSALGACEPGERLCAQLIVTAEHTTVGSDRVWWVRALAGGFWLLGRVVFGLWDLFMTSHHTSSTAPSGGRAANAAPDPDPVVQTRRRAVAAKRAHGPHLRVTLRVVYHTTAGGPGVRRGHRRAVVGLAGGFDLAAPLTTLRVHRAGGDRRTVARVDARRPARRRFRFAATITELAGLWHLPAEPTQYGMADAVGRVRRPARGLPRIPRRPGAGPDRLGVRDDAA